MRKPAYCLLLSAVLLSRLFLFSPCPVLAVPTTTYMIDVAEEATVVLVGKVMSVEGLKGDKRAYMWESFRYGPVQLQVEEVLDGEFEGIGAYVAIDDDGNITIVAPIKDTPADKAGIKPDSSDYMNMMRTILEKRGQYEAMKQFYQQFRR